MRLKEILAVMLRPDIRKLFLFFILAAAYLYYWELMAFVAGCSDCKGLYGYPLPFIVDGALVSDSVLLSISFVCADAAFWYTLTCEIVFARDVAGGKILSSWKRYEY